MILEYEFIGSKGRLMVTDRYKPYHEKGDIHHYSVNFGKDVPFTNYGIDYNYDYYYRWIVTETEKDVDGDLYEYRELFCIEIPSELKQLKEQDFEAFLTKLEEVPDNAFEYLASFPNAQSIIELFELGDDIKLLDSDSNEFIDLNSLGDETEEPINSL